MLAASTRNTDPIATDETDALDAVEDNLIHEILGSLSARDDGHLIAERWHTAWTLMRAGAPRGALVS